MKRCDKYPEAEDCGESLPPVCTFCGLHPLVWVFIIVLGVAGAMAFDHLEDADWDRGPLSEEADDSHDDNDDDEEEDQPEAASEDPAPSSSSTSTAQ